jgi:glycosyltransferase involved in cell wall biosynthesis
MEKFGLTERFEFTGVLTGAAKHQAYMNADIFCFQMFFQSESFGLVVAEAMAL